MEQHVHINVDGTDHEGNFEKAFGLSMDQMLEMQTWYDVHAMRNKEHEITVDRYEAARA
ncbi:MAG: hypothetical protein V3V97_12305 [Hyphomicrobiaceae bacterium]